MHDGQAHGVLIERTGLEVSQENVDDLLGASEDSEVQSPVPCLGLCIVTQSLSYSWVLRESVPQPLDYLICVVQACCL